MILTAGNEQVTNLLIQGEQSKVHGAGSRERHPEIYGSVKEEKKHFKLIEKRQIHKYGFIFLFRLIFI